MNQISDGAIIRTQQEALITPEGADADPVGQFNTFISTTAATVDANGNPYGNAKALTAYKKALVATGMSRADIGRTLSRIPDPVLKGKWLADRPGMKQEMDIAVSNRDQNALKVYANRLNMMRC